MQAHISSGFRWIHTGSVRQATAGAYNFAAAVALCRTFTAMAAWWPCLWFAAFFLLSAAIPAASDLFKTFRPGNIEPLESHECPRSCSDVFHKLQWRQKGYGGGGHYQKLHVQERGGMTCSREYAV